MLVYKDGKYYKVNKDGEIVREANEKELKEIEEAIQSLRIRKITPEEAFLFQGMTIDDVAKCRAMGISDTSLYQQAGNGLGTPCVRFIMEHIKKMHHPEYVTTDEKMVEMYGECN